MWYLTHPAWFRRAVREAGFEMGVRRGGGFAHQIVHDQARLNRWMNRVPPFRVGMTGLSRMADAVLGRIDWSLMQFVRLTRSGTPDDAVDSNIDVEPMSFLDLLACPACRAAELAESESGMRCASCGRTYPKTGPVFDLRV